MAANETLNAVVFEDSEDELYRRLAQEAVVEAGWQAEVFKTPSLAEKMVHQGRTDALITALGTSGSWFGPKPATELIRLSDELMIPRAILSAHPHADEFVRPDSSDILVPKVESTLIVERLTTWLLGLAEKE